MKRKILGIIIIGFLLMSSPTAFSVDLDARQNQGDSKSEFEINDLIFSFSFEKPMTREITVCGEPFTRVHIQDCKLYGKTGTPCLPVKPLRILLPQGRTVDEITLDTIKPVEIDKIDNVELGGGIHPLNIHYSDKTPSPTYDVSSLYPGSIYKNLGVQYFRGFTILHINLHPAQIIGETSTLFYYPQMTLTVTTKPNYVNPLYRGFEADNEKLSNKIDIFNVSVLSTYVTSDKDGSSSSYDYVIITTKEFGNYDGMYDFAELIARRESQGLSATIKAVEDIYEEYDGVDNEEKIRNFIKDAYQNYGTTWVLLGGDIEYVPARCLYDIDGADIGMASDIYYQCLDGNYNNDNDSWYGEEHDGVNGGKIDLYAEVYIGRASVDSTEQIENFVRKTLAYEDYKWGLDYHLKVAESVGEHVWSGSGGWGAGYIERCIDHCTDYGQDTHGIPSDRYTTQKLYERDMNYLEYDIINDINGGVNFINHLGHSSPTSCMKLSPEEIADLDNTKYGFWYSQGCHAGRFAVADECMAEAWTLYDNGGFAAIMNTGYGYGSNDNYDGPDNRFAREFWDALNSSEEKISRLGVANQDSKEDNMWHMDDGNAMYHNCYSTSLFGDPFVQIKGMEDFRADFYWVPEFPKPGDSIYFYDDSLNAEETHWEFGDGESSNDLNPVHAYNESGVYSVTLTINGAGKTDSCTRHVGVWNNWPPHAVPSPKFIATDFPTIIFQAGDSWDSDGNIVSHHWDFGDRTTSDKISPIHTFEDDGVYNVTLTVTDDGGKEDTAICDIRIDQYTPPESEVIIGGEYGNNSWLLSFAQISLDASDWSGVKRTKYSIGGSNWETYKNPVQIDLEGVHTVEFYSVDIWGNTEDVKTQDFKIDTKSPSLNIEFTGEKYKGWYISPVMVDCTGGDEMSGLNRIMYNIDGEMDVWEIYEQPLVVSDDGLHIVCVFAEDYAGHTTGKNQTYSIHVDTNPPDTSCNLSGDPSSGGNIIVTLGGVDDGIGVNYTMYSLDGQPEQQYIDSFVVTGDGSHKVTFYSVDSLGHIEEMKTKEFNIGGTPQIEITKPTSGVYLNNNEIVFLPGSTIIIGSIDVKCDYTPDYVTLNSVKFYVNGELKKTDTTMPYSWTWGHLIFGKKTLKVEAEFGGYTAEKEIAVYKFF